MRSTRSQRSLEQEMRIQKDIRTRQGYYGIGKALKKDGEGDSNKTTHADSLNIPPQQFPFSTDHHGWTWMNGSSLRFLSRLPTHPSCLEFYIIPFLPPLVFALIWFIHYASSDFTPFSRQVVSPSMVEHDYDHHGTAGMIIREHMVFPSVGFQVVSQSLHLLGVSIIAHFISRRLRLEDVSSLHGLVQISWARLCIVLCFIDSWSFLFASGILVQGVGLELGYGTCSFGILSCIVLYATSKLFIYLFLVEKVHVVWSTPGTPRLRSKVYITCFVVVMFYVVVGFYLIYQRIAYFRGDGTCVIGLKSLASVVLLVYDLFINMFLTSLFLWPLFRTRILNRRLRRVTGRAVVAAFVSLTSSCVNILVLAIMHGEQPGWICLSSCGLDVIVNSSALFWVTSGTSLKPETSRNREREGGNQDDPSLPSYSRPSSNRKNSKNSQKNRNSYIPNSPSEIKTMSSQFGFKFSQGLTDVDVDDGVMSLTKEDGDMDMVVDQESESGSPERRLRTEMSLDLVSPGDEVHPSSPISPDSTRSVTFRPTLDPICTSSSPQSTTTPSLIISPNLLRFPPPAVTERSESVFYTPNSEIWDPFDCPTTSSGRSYRSNSLPGRPRAATAASFWSHGFVPLALNLNTSGWRLRRDLDSNSTTHRTETASSSPSTQVDISPSFQLKNTAVHSGEHDDDITLVESVHTDS
ncbi:hypothetical protein C8Q75DRAFT_263365 [Abortiporus biennis]|nr:hypothetical protein C8Q75DRAFT_263365 [Abortiporus biennis]